MTALRRAVPLPSLPAPAQRRRSNAAQQPQPHHAGWPSLRLRPAGSGSVRAIHTHTTRGIQDEGNNPAPPVERLREAKKVKRVTDKPRRYSLPA